ncbi:glycosyltransferase [Bifidobacterium stellenboschense]|uniref:Exopolysaccharide biosynthesis protein n=1 Tax=Bifidobacterium stellenboschense TaxID=762211 RepID=A0A087DKU1_9BIFI|nr:glycosyltransferase [Bifidobacterium stellenboschense]KFI96141.1 exopolysaccharide biosynthesis protein [Bifidobacterium stellenboschense]
MTATKRRVLIIQEAMGGCGRHVVDLVEGLDPERFDVTVMYGTSRIDDYYRKALPAMAGHARLIPCDDLVRPISPAHELRALRAVMRVIREFRPEVVHCHSSKAGVIGRLAVLLCGRHSGVRRVFYTPHAYSFQAPEFGGRKRVVFVGLERWMSRHATTLTFNVSAGERDAALAERLDTPAKFEVVYNGVADVPVPSRAEARALLGLDGLGVPADAPVVGVTARLVEQKDPLTAIGVMKRVVEQRPDAHLVMVGDGDLEPAAREAAAGIADHVHFLGYRPDAERVVAAFDVYLLSSLYEGMPYSLVEALRAGVPIAATDTTGNDEVVTPGANGTLFPVGDAEAGAKAVLGLLEHPIPTEQVRRTYRERFTLDRMLETISARYEGVPPTGGERDEEERA